jgi:Holliday junction resolvase RusA-like endonuclease
VQIGEAVVGRFAAALASIRGDSIALTADGIRGTIHGALPGKSNSRRLVPFRGRMRSIKAQDALDFLARFDVAASDDIRLAMSGVDPDARWSLHATVYQANLRRDLDIELLCDALQKSGVIANDRAIWEKHARREIDKARPRVEWKVRVMTEKERAYKSAPGCDHAWRETSVGSYVCEKCWEETA